MRAHVLVVVAVLLGVAAGRMRATPFGRFDERCIHVAPSGSHFRTVNGSVVVEHPSFASRRVLPKCAAHMRQRQFGPEYDGWLAYTSYLTTQPTFDTFLGNFSVPLAPANMPEELFIFTGLQNVDWIPKVDPEPPVFDIIQPVLQFPADSGSGWSLKSWYVTLDSGVVETPEVPCVPSDVIFGNMTLVKRSAFGGKWYVGGTVARTGQTAAFTAERLRLKTQPWAYTTVECYGCQDCSYLPTNSLFFTGMTGSYSGTNIPFVWSTFVSPKPVCSKGPTARVVSSQAVTYKFQ